MSDYTIGEIAAAHGEKVRTIQFWADSGALIPVEGTGRKGKGTQRRFSEAEMRLAGLARRLAATNSPIGEIVEVLDYIRKADPIAALDEAKSLSLEHQTKLRSYEDDPKKFTRFSVINTYFKILNVLLIGGAAREDVNLIISYYFEDGVQKSRILFLPAATPKPIEVAASAALHGFIGFKTILLKPERDIWIGEHPDKEISALLEKAFVAYSQALQNLTKGWARNA